MSFFHDNSIWQKVRRHKLIMFCAFIWEIPTNDFWNPHKISIPLMYSWLVFFRSNISKNLPEGSIIGCFRPFFGGEISNTNKIRIYFRHKSIPGGQKTFSGFLRISQISDKSSCLVEMESGYKIGNRYVTKSDSWQFHEICPKILFLNTDNLNTSQESQESA